MPTQLSKEAILKNIETWDLNWLLWWMGNTGSVVVTGQPKKMWVCSWTPGRSIVLGYDSSGSAAGPENAVRAAAREGVETHYDHWTRKE